VVAPLYKLDVFGNVKTPNLFGVLGKPQRKNRGRKSYPKDAAELAGVAEGT
jgi:hypothetical protein